MSLETPESPDKPNGCSVCTSSNVLFKLYLSDIEEQGDGVVEVGVGTAGIDPEMPKYRKQRRAHQQHA